jgi:hypothetical protein
MTDTNSLALIKPKSPEEVLGGLRNEDSVAARSAAEKLIKTARSHGVGMKDYLRLAVRGRLSEKKEDYEGLDGYEASLSYLGLPYRNSFDDGVTLDLASDTFQTFPGTRALFPYVIDDMVRWSYRQDQLETTDPIVALKRTIVGNELIRTVVNDAAADYQAAVSAIPELANIPVQSIRTSENSVKMYKIGGGYRTSYEFTRRARLDLLTPYANRINRELERSKVAYATSLLINGDGVQSAAPVVTQSSFTGGSIAASTNGQLSYKHLLSWLVNRAAAGAPVDTVLGSWAAYIEWLLMFATPLTTGGMQSATAANNMAAAGFKMAGVPILNGVVNFAISSTAPASQLIGFTKAETLEELNEANSLIQESDRAVNNQSITFYKTEVTGFSLPFGDTRSIFNYGA